MTPEKAQAMKEKGNESFKAGKYEEALLAYTQALALQPADKEKATLLKNRAACALKLNRPEQAAQDSSAALLLGPNDPKALFRRCQAYELLDRHEEAYQDAARLLTVEPKNGKTQEILARLTPIIQSKVNKQRSTESKVAEMFRLATDAAGDAEKRRQACNNLIVLAREPSGAQQIVESGGVQKIVTFLDDVDPSHQLTGLRVLACLAQDDVGRSRLLIGSVDLHKVQLLVGCEHEELSAGAALLLHNLLVGCSDLRRLRRQRDKYERDRLGEPGCRDRPHPFVSETIDREALPLVDRLMRPISGLIRSKKVSQFGRENLMELLIKVVDRKEGLGWSTMFVDCDGVQALLEVAGSVKEHGGLRVLPQSRLTASLVLSRLFDDMAGDESRSKFKSKADEYFTEMFADGIMESKLQAVMALSALLQGPFEVGNHVLGRDGVLEMMLAMIDSGDPIYTRYAVEALVSSSSKKDRCSGVIKQATPILKQLYRSDDDGIKVRALVGLCKLGSFGGGDSSARSFAEGSTRALAKACRKFLCNEAKDVDLRKWASEGLAFLTLDAEVKDDLIKDSNSIRSLIELAKAKDKSVLYPVATTFVNLTNSYAKKDVDPELVELAKFAKHHVPEEHSLDKEPHVSQRRRQLVREGTVAAVVAFSQLDTSSENCREQLSRILLACSSDKEDRGLVVAQGGSKLLLSLATSNNTPAGRIEAAVALSKIGVSLDPSLAFPGQRSCEAVRPLLQLLHYERSAMENYEALMALTNLAATNDTVRRRMMKEEGFMKIEHYCFEEHEQLRRAASECMCNLVLLEDAVQLFKRENDRLKMFLLFCGEEDVGLIRASAGAVAVLSRDPEICRKLLTVTPRWCDLLKLLVVSDIPDIQYRGVYIVMNMMAEEATAKQVVASSLFEIIMAVSKLQDERYAPARECANEALSMAQEYQLIKPSEAIQA